MSHSVWGGFGIIIAFSTALVLSYVGVAKSVASRLRIGAILGLTTGILCGLCFCGFWWLFFNGNPEKILWGPVGQTVFISVVLGLWGIMVGIFSTLMVGIMQNSFTSAIVVVTCVSLVFSLAFNLAFR
jgi:hypothetical protein